MVVAPSVASAAKDSPAVGAGTASMLYDATICTGCKACMSACNAVNDLSPDTGTSDGKWQMPIDLNSKTKNIIQLYKDPGGVEWSFVKRQCMHCLDPACVSGCPFGALHKDATSGAVTWKASACIGCRYCQIACPYQVPQFEWDRFNPRIVKCEFCLETRLMKGQQPGCASACPSGAAIFGTREKLLAEAKRRIAASPGKYFENRFYGEHDGGGTQVLYLSRVSYAKIGFPDIGTRPLPEYATEVSSKMFKWMAGPAIVYGLLAAAINRNWKHHEAERLEHEAEGHPPEQL
jgi:Fe-S-cluster-containing dehydrogenase component